MNINLNSIAGIQQILSLIALNKDFRTQNNKCVDLFDTQHIANILEASSTSFQKSQSVTDVINLLKHTSIKANEIKSDGVFDQALENKDWNLHKIAVLEIKTWNDTLTLGLTREQLCMVRFVQLDVDDTINYQHYLNNKQNYHYNNTEPVNDFTRVIIEVKMNHGLMTATSLEDIFNQLDNK